MPAYIEAIFRQAGHRGKSALQALKRAPDGQTRGAADKLTAIFPEKALPPLIMRCLGKFEVTVDGREIPSGSWRSLAAARLFKFLVLKTGQGFVPKDILLEFLWPEENPEVTNKRFHVALSTLRRLLEPGLKRGVASAYILRLNDAYRLETGPGGRIDFKAFLSEIDAADRIEKCDEAAAMNRYLAAESLHGGALLEEDLFVDAFISDRILLQQCYLHVLSKLLHLFELNENWTSCLSFAEKYLAIEPASEPVHCAIMRCYFALGETARIAAAFNRCRSLITAELGTPPGPEVEQLYRHLMETRFEASGPASPARAYPRLIAD
ncbi:MAG: BTAD domain-containing putative transcriptional regulator [Pseudomonadota bacterium]